MKQVDESEITRAPLVKQVSEIEMTKAESIKAFVTGGPGVMLHV